MGSGLTFDNVAHRGKWGEKDREKRRKENRQTETKQAWTGDGQWEERSVNPVSVNPIRWGWGAVFRKKSTVCGSHRPKKTRREEHECLGSL